MKGAELTESGFYWYKDGRGWTMTHFESRDSAYPLTYIGNDTPFRIDDFPGVFVGPILSPDHADYFHLVEYVIRKNGEPTRVRCQLAEIPDWAQHLF